MAISTNRPDHRVTDILGWEPNDFFIKSVKNENAFPHVKVYRISSNKRPRRLLRRLLNFET